MVTGNTWRSQAASNASAWPRSAASAKRFSIAGRLVKVIASTVSSQIASSIAHRRGLVVGAQPLVRGDFDDLGARGPQRERRPGRARTRRVGSRCERPRWSRSSRWSMTSESRPDRPRQRTSQPMVTSEPAAFGPRATTSTSRNVSASCSPRPQLSAALSQDRMPIPVLATRTSGGLAMISSVATRSGPSATIGSVCIVGPCMTRAPWRCSNSICSPARRSAVTATTKPSSTGEATYPTLDAVCFETVSIAAQIFDALRLRNIRWWFRVPSIVAIVRCATLRVSVTDRCDFRCSYCMPEHDYTWLPREDILSFEEIETLVRAFAAAGVNKLRLTGGEPLLRRGLPSLIARLAAIDGIDDISLTTNGASLATHAAALRDAGSAPRDGQPRHAAARAPPRADPARQPRCGARGDRVAAPTSAFAFTKINTVVLRGVNDDELVELLAYAATARRRTALHRIHGRRRRNHVAARCRGARWRKSSTGCAATAGVRTPVATRASAPARRYALPSGQVFGVVASTSEPFCASCDRSRITADGMWFALPVRAGGTDLRALLRERRPDAVRRAIRSMWVERDDQGAVDRVGDARPRDGRPRRTAQARPAPRDAHAWRVMDITVLCFGPTRDLLGGDEISVTARRRRHRRRSVDRSCAAQSRRVGRPIAALRGGGRRRHGGAHPRAARR